MHSWRWVFGKESEDSRDIKIILLRSSRLLYTRINAFLLGPWDINLQVYINSLWHIWGFSSITRDLEILSNLSHVPQSTCHRQLFGLIRKSIFCISYSSFSILKFLKFHAKPSIQTLYRTLARNPPTPTPVPNPISLPKANHRIKTNAKTNAKT